MGSRTRSRTNEAIREAYIEWMKIPREMRLAERNSPNPRFPATKQEFCDKYGTTRTTLFRWDNDPEFKREVSNEALGLVTADDLVQMIAVQKKKALNGDRASFKLLMDYFKIAGEGLIGPEAPKDENQFDRMTDAEIEALIGDDFDD